MSIDVKFNVVLRNKEDLKEYLSHAQYDPGQWQLITQVGAYGDIRPTLDLLDIVNDWLTDVVALRGENPDLHGRFCEAVEKLNKKKAEFEETIRTLKEYNENKK